MKFYNLNKERGFTLIELLVVIAIIGLLSSVVLASLNGARKKGRDARRLADLKQIQVALELFYGDQATPAYPVNTTQNTTAPGFVTALNASLAPAYIAALPVDPSGGIYYYKTTALGAYYCLGALMEGSVIPASSCNTTTLGGAMATANYSVGP